MKSTTRQLWIVLVLGLLLPATGWSRDQTHALRTPPSLPVSAGQMLSPDFWIARLRHPNRVALTPHAIAARNAELLRLDPSMHDLAALPDRLDRATVLPWLAMSRRPTAALFDIDGHAVSAATLDSLLENADVAGLPLQQATRYGLAVRRAALRTFPTAMRVFTSIGDTDIDRFQESALFPGTPVVIAHHSQDGRWLFVLTPRYAAWVDATAIAEGSRRQVMEYAEGNPVRVVTGATVRTAVTPEAPRVSYLQLDMGLRLPIAAVPNDAVVNGQQAGAAWAVELPVREPTGALALQPTLIPRAADTAGAALPLTRANAIRQAFKFLGERYGWGDDYNARDCSGFVSVVFASMGVVLPRNTGDQARSPVFQRVHLDNTSAAERQSILARLRPGDLVYMPGHVMLVIGQIGHEPYVIHDIHEGKVVDGDGRLRSLRLNGVAVSPLRSLRLDRTRRFVDAITDIVSPLKSAELRP
jgi:cell wall-associated NlpC family hydrolase